MLKSAKQSLIYEVNNARLSIIVFRGIFDTHGRLMVIMTHNTDIADGWERENEDWDFFEKFSYPAYAVGINVALYTMSH